MSENILRERLAELCHKQWSGWMKYLFCFGVREEGGTFTMAADKVARWSYQMRAPYHALSEAEKESDRIEADKFLRLIGECPGESADDMEASMTHQRYQKCQHLLRDLLWVVGHDEELAGTLAARQAREFLDAIEGGC